MRIALLAILFASAAFSQVPLSGTVPDSRIRTFLYHLDLGASSVSYTVTASLNTGSASGLAVRFIDLTGVAGDASPTSTFIDEQTVAGVGTANCALSGTGSGVRGFALEIRTAGAGSSGFNGSVSATTGGLAFVKEDQIVVGATGLLPQVDHIATLQRNVSSGLSAQGVELNFGSTSQNVPFRFEAVGTGLTKIDVYDNTGGSATLIGTFTASGGNINDVTVFIRNHSGVANLRVNVTGAVGGGSVTWRLYSPTTVTLGVPGSNDSKVDESDSCTTSESTGAWALVAAAAMMLAVARIVKAKRKPGTK
jgi:hypothetical protein